MSESIDIQAGKILLTLYRSDWDDEKISQQATDSPTTRDCDIGKIIAAGQVYTTPPELDSEFSQRNLPRTERSVLNEEVPHEHSSRNFCANGRYPLGSLEKYGEDQWIKEDPPSSTYIRNQSHAEGAKTTMSESRIQLNTLTSLSPNSMSEARFWFHATSWQWAEEIRKFGPGMFPKSSDLAVNGAFYLNPAFEDCYDWLLTKNGVLQGQHAILIYRFAFSDLAGRGGELINLAEWKKTVRQWSTVRRPDDWTYTFQDSDPKNAESKYHHATPRRMRNGEYTMQLIIWSEELCRQIHPYLVGGIFCEKLVPAKKNRWIVSDLSLFRKHLFNCASQSFPTRSGSLLNVFLENKCARMNRMFFFECQSIS